MGVLVIVEITRLNWKTAEESNVVLRGELIGQCMEFQLDMYITLWARFCLDKAFILVEGGMSNAQR